MTNVDTRIMGISLLFGVGAWIGDAVLDALVFYNGPFLELLITNVPPHELFIRTALLGSFLLFGLIASSLVQHRREHEKELEEKTSELENLTAQLAGQYRTLFEEAPVMAVVTQEQDGRPIIEDCNNRFLDRLGYEKHAVEGSELVEFYTQKSREKLLEAGGYERALDDEITRERRELLTAEDEIVETEFRAIPRRNVSGESIGTLAMYVDISEREHVKQANERLDEFTHIVSHDLRNPINVAQGRLEMAKEECSSEHLTSAERALDRMSLLIDDMLTLAREGEQVGDMETVNFQELVSTCWGNVQTRDATVQMDVEKALLADKSRVEQLLENLIRNAIEHGGEEVEITIGELSDGFYFEDDGPGIPAENREEIFESGYTTSETGTGYGLRIVKDVVEAHGWEIHVTEGAEGGARFEFTEVEFAPQ